MWEYDVAPEGKSTNTRQRGITKLEICSAVGPQASKEQLRKHWIYWVNYCPHLLDFLSM